MFYRRPEVHSKRSYLNLNRNILLALAGFHAIAYYNVIASVTALLAVLYVILLTYDSHITSALNYIDHIIDILNELADYSYTCHVLYHFHDMVNWKALFLGFLNNTGNLLHPAGDLFNR